MDEATQGLQIIGASVLGDGRASHTSERVHDGPSDPLELQLVQLWERVLNVHPVGITDNFFALGGDSLRATALRAEIEKEYGRQVPVQLLFEAPTVKQMAARLRTKDWPLPATSLVTLQGQGTHRPLYIVPGGRGEMIHLTKLVPYLGPEQPLYAFRTRELDGEPLPHTDVPAMAADYIQEIRAVQPRGPYLLAGLCAGGMVAYEMAQQLRARGEEVPLLLVVDLARRQYMGYYTWWPIRRIYRLARAMPHLLSRVGFRLRQLHQPGLKGKTTFVLSKVKQAGQLVLDDTYTEYTAMICRYRPKPYAGRITLLLCEESYRYERRKPQRSWRGLAHGGLELHVFPGNHATRYTEHLPEMAGQIRACLETAQVQCG